MLSRVEVSCQGCDTWGLLPVFHATAKTTDTMVADPDGDIIVARWFDPMQLPEDTRDRDALIDAARAIG